MSWPPDPPARSLAKNIRSPSSENVGTNSVAAELIVDPRFTGAPQASLTAARCETPMSLPPNPPGLVTDRPRLRPSPESAGPSSLAAELTTGPRFTGADQSL